MSGRARSARLNYNMAKAVGIDDMAGMLDFRKKVDDYNEAVAAAQRKAKKKSGLLGFIGTLVTAAVAFTNPFGFASLLAQGGVAAALGSGARMVVDSAYGELKAPPAPKLKGTKYNKLKRQEQQQTISEGYDQLSSDLRDIEQDIDMGHLIEPFTQSLAYFGPQVIAQNADMAEAIADTSNSINNAADFKASLPNPDPNYWTMAGIAGGAGLTALAVAGETDGMDDGPGGAPSDSDEDEDSEDVNWDEVYANLGFTPDSDSAIPSSPGGVSYSQRIDDLDYLEDLTDGEV